jgi:hypothetical protein
MPRSSSFLSCTPGGLAIITSRVWEVGVPHRQLYGLPHARQRVYTTRRIGIHNFPSLLARPFVSSPLLERKRIGVRPCRHTLALPGTVPDCSLPIFPYQGKRQAFCITHSSVPGCGSNLNTVGDTITSACDSRSFTAGMRRHEPWRRDDLREGILTYHERWRQRVA